MESRDNRPGPEAKHPYEKPGLEALDLATDEVLAVGCKTSTSGNAVGGSTCVQNNCVSPGS